MFFDELMFDKVSVSQKTFNIEIIIKRLEEGNVTERERKLFTFQPQSSGREKQKT
jgi:hypothetical protein